MNDLSLASSGLVDFHCHLDLYPDHLGLIEECERLGIKTLSVTNAPSVWPRNKRSVEYCRHVRVALGLHPQLAHEREREIELFERYLPETRYVGEVGLDGSPDYSSTKGIQRRIFRRILELCAQAGGKVLTVHSRRATREVIEMISTYLPQDRGKVVLHWFTGTKREAKQAIEAGCYFSVNIRMLESEQRRDLVDSLPRDLVLTETDGPFVRIGEAVTKPKDVVKTIEGLASLWKTDEPNVIASIKENLITLLA